MVRPHRLKSNPFQLYKGGSGSGGSGAGGGGGGAEEAAPTPSPQAQADTPPPPSGAKIEKVEDFGFTAYKYNIRGQELEVTFENFGGGTVDVNFKVNGSYSTFEKGDPRTGVAIVAKVRATVLHYAATEKPTEFVTTPAAGDRLRGRRAEVYKRFGFKKQKGSKELVLKLEDGKLPR